MNRRLARESLSEGMDITVDIRAVDAESQDERVCMNFSFSVNNPSVIKVTIHPETSHAQAFAVKRRPLQDLVATWPLSSLVCMLDAVGVDMLFHDESLEDFKYFFASVEYVSPRAKLAPEKASASV